MQRVALLMALHTLAALGGRLVRPAAALRCSVLLAHAPARGLALPAPQVPAISRQRIRAVAGGKGSIGKAKIVVHDGAWIPPATTADATSPGSKPKEEGEFDNEEFALFSDGDDDDDEVAAAANPFARMVAPRQPRAEIPAFEATLDVPLGRCAGCGVVLQAAVSGSPGFLPQPGGLERAQVIGHRVICGRCHGLRHQNSADKEVRVGHSTERKLSPRYFEDLLEACLLGHDARSPSGVTAPANAGCGVVVYLVDLFDVEGSLLPSLPRLVGDTPLILVGNKVDALPSGTSLERVEKWLRQACRERLGGIEPAEVHLISASTGKGIAKLGDSVLRWASRRRQYGDVYVVGAANVGKSSFINAMISPNTNKKQKRVVGAKGGVSLAELALADLPGAQEGLFDEEEEEEDIEAAAERPLSKGEKAALARQTGPRLLTASHLPGTTLEPVRVRCRNGLSLFDTPGLVLEGQLARRLTPQEVALLLPRAPIKPAQISLGAGKSLLLGGVARVDVLACGFAAQLVLAVHAAPSLTLHPTATERAEEMRQRHVGGMLSPPLGGRERLEMLGPLETTDIEIEGVGFRRAAADVAIGGIGWLAVLGDGLIKLRVHAPKHVPVVPREPLIPFIDGTRGNSKFTGTRVIKPEMKKKRR
ncbi:hypothetical protein T492DRAFT_622318 [Pavlovales sp. CCMP2436]|nr:hypothetical protein T492DRAFT_622318 [Pavlovales sp. CCMP2436]|mmetsp:Transcript_43095/g.106369  ORF Transcript_43095/g.106369 Transcript_43095/m.106369 type:complete len:648 (+) Transcript_43095:115-2058(+)